MFAHYTHRIISAARQVERDRPPLFRRHRILDNLFLFTYAIAIVCLLVWLIFTGVGDRFNGSAFSFVLVAIMIAGGLSVAKLDEHLVRRLDKNSHKSRSKAIHNSE